MRSRPVSRLLLAAALAWAVSLPPLASPSFRRLLDPVLSEGLAAGVWVAMILLFIPLPAPRPLARAGAGLLGFLTGVLAPLLVGFGYVVVLILAGIEGIGPDMPDRPPSSGAELALEIAAAAIFGSLPPLLAGLGVGAVGLALHRALDSRLRRDRRASWAWLAPAAWAAVTPLWAIVLLAPWYEDLPRGAFLVTSAVVFLSLATLPHLLAQIALARRLANVAPAAVMPNAQQ